MIRPACLLDVPAIINLGNRYVEQEVKTVGHHSASWNATESAHHLALAISHEALFLHVAVRDNEVVGFLWGGTHMLAPWDLTLVASDYLFYVTPEFRGTAVGMGLIKAWRNWAESQGCKEVRLSLASGINEERVGKMYSLLGFSPFGTVYNHKF